MAPDTNKAKDSAASIFSILDSKPQIDSSNDEGITMENVTGNIELEHVSFKYPTRPEFQIFKDLCLTIPAGKVTKDNPLSLVSASLLETVDFTDQEDYPLHWHC